jgi:hypothetical protein
MPFNTSDPEINALHLTMHWLIEHWQFALFTIGSAIGGVVWWLHITFASKAHMEKCRLDVATSQDIKLDRFHKENKEEHKELRQDVKSILAHLLDKD